LLAGEHITIITITIIQLYTTPHHPRAGERRLGDSM